MNQLANIPEQDFRGLGKGDAKRLRATRETHHVPLPEKRLSVVNPDCFKQPVAVQKPTVDRRYPRLAQRQKLIIQAGNRKRIGHDQRLRDRLCDSEKDEWSDQRLGVAGFGWFTIIRPLSDR